MSRARLPAADSTFPSGNFDYYLFTLSWSPEYCHGHPNNPQCGGAHPGFVVHGLWPQFDNGQWPSACSSAPALSNPSSMLDIMPDPRLIQHEWTTHGTCSGLSADQYFGVIRRAYNSITIPPPLVSPTRTTTRSAGEIKQMFLDANPGMSSVAVAVTIAIFPRLNFVLAKTCSPPPARPCATARRTPSGFPRRNRLPAYRESRNFGSRRLPKPHQDRGAFSL
jgi:ribonuclease T2